MCLAQSRQASLDHVVPRTLQLCPGNVTDLDEQSSIFPKEISAIVVCYTVQVWQTRNAANPLRRRTTTRTSQSIAQLCHAQTPAVVFTAVARAKRCLIMLPTSSSRGKASQCRLKPLQIALGGKHGSRLCKPQPGSVHIIV